MNVKVFKLINGEDLIAEVEESSDFFTVKNPASIVMQQTERGVGVALAPYMPYATGDLILYKTGLTACGIPELQMTNEYSRIFGSGIQIAAAGSIAIR